MTPAGAVAVFDSGVGGLTVYRALRRRLPREPLLYFGDTAHVPYGTKSPETVRRLARAHARFLARRRVKCAVIACNTASAVALPAIRAAIRAPVLGVIEAGVAAALDRSRTGRIGVLGTSTTIASGAYQRALARRGGRGIAVTAVACPLLVPLIEEGWVREPVTRAVARRYLAPVRRARADAVILGCTHYPLLKPVLRSLLGPGVALVDSAEAVAGEVEALLAAEGFARRGSGRGPEAFYLTDVAGTFRTVAARFLGRPIPGPRRVDVKVEALYDSAKGGRL